MLNQNPRQADFVLGTCPHCEKVVRIPVTAVTSQSKSLVRCPICDSEFELAEVLEEMIPAVQIVDDIQLPAVKPTASIPDKINAIDTPELFKVSRENYEPSTEKRNGRFVVPELLSKGIEKKNRKRSRRRSRSKSNDPKLAESLAKLKENTSTTTLPTENETEARKSGKSGRSRKSKKRPGTIDRIPTPSLSRIRSVSDLVEFFKACRSLLFSRIRNKSKNLRANSEKPSSKAEWLMIGLGALIAIPLLHLMMWWFIGVDPLGLAKPTSHVVPFVVPNKLRAVILDSEDLPAEPSKQTIDSVEFRESTSTRNRDGKLPKPKLDPSSVHIDNL